MTREEAIKRLKSWAIASKEDREVLKTLIPELRESEDENLKNKSGYYKAGKFWKASTLWNAVKGKSPQRVPNRYILQECTWDISSLQHFADEVKNVQEVDLNYPIILDMNGNILDGAHRVVKAYLEGKDVDIVYLGDGEWPEPDYDEEKAVKESEDERMRKELIEFIKSLLCNNAFDRYKLGCWIAWLEKQKENPKSSDSIPSNCTSDVKCEDRWHKVEDSLPNNTREVLCKDAIGNYFIGRYYSKGIWEISMYDDCDKSNEDNPPVVMWIDIPSEKQKEQKPINQCNTHEPTLDEARKWNEAYEKGYSLGYENGRNEQKPAEWAELQSEFRNINEAFEDGKKEVVGNPEKYGLCKPAEWGEEDEVYLQDALWCVNQAAKVAREENDMGACWSAERWLKSLRPVKQKWSKEDEMYLSQAIETLEHENYSILADKLKSLRPSWKPTEDEERLINTSISFLKDFADKGYENAFECIDWLKSKLNEKSTDA